MSVIAQNIHLRLGRAQILHGVDFTARAGEITAIIGPNGSGKTSLMRVLTGELAPERGEVVLNGRPVCGQPPEALARSRAVLPQQSALSFPFTVAEIIRIGLNSSVAAEAERAARIRAALARVGLPSYAGRFYQELSGGEQQRVQLARALVQVWHPVGEDGPRWLFLDEPVSSLDIAHQLTVMRLARSYASSGGGVIAVMHDLNLTAMFADHVLLMQRGQVRAAGAPGEVMTDTVLSDAYGCQLQVGHIPAQGVWILPQGASVAP